MPEHQPAEPGPAHGREERRDDDEGGERAEAAEHGEDAGCPTRPTRRLSGARNGCSGSRLDLRRRRAITEACAIVNESIAPKA